MDISFKDTCVVITGGSTGTGFVCAKRFLESGARVAIISGNPDNLKKAEKELSAFGEVTSYQLNLLDSEKIPDLVKQIRSDMGEIDVLVQAAATREAHKIDKALDLTPDGWDRIMAINCKSFFFMMQQVVKQSMIPHKRGTIVNIASIAGVRGMPKPLCSPTYSASKGGVIALTRQAAVEWGEYNIRVNAVAPAGITEDGKPESAPPEFFKGQRPLASGCTQSDVAAMVMYLAADACSCITGSVTVLDGGAHIVGN